MVEMIPAREILKAMERTHSSKDSCTSKIRTTAIPGQTNRNQSTNQGRSAEDESVKNTAAVAAVETVRTTGHSHTDLRSLEKLVDSSVFIGIDPFKMARCNHFIFKFPHFFRREFIKKVKKRFLAGSDGEIRGRSLFVFHRSYQGIHITAQNWVSIESHRV